jgi:hypothetical protein
LRHKPSNKFLIANDDFFISLPVRAIKGWWGGTGTPPGMPYGEKSVRDADSIYIIYFIKKIKGYF